VIAILNVNDYIQLKGNKTPLGQNEPISLAGFHIGEDSIKNNCKLVTVQGSLAFAYFQRT
jgi:hypothetical protein